MRPERTQTAWMLALALAGLAAGRLAHSVQGEQPSFTLALEGRPACTIVISARPQPAARLAALELQYHVMKIAGAELPIRSDNEPTAGPRVLVGESTATRELGFKGFDFAPQEYLIAVRPQTLVLIGRDWEDTEANRKVEGRPMAWGETLQALRHKVDYWKAVGRPDRSVGEMELPGIHDDQGTCLATYDFLERFCGVRWYGPSDISIVIPSRKTLTVSGSDVRRSPALKHRIASMGNWPFMRGPCGDYSREQVYLWARRMRQGGERWAGNHTFHRQTIKTVFTDPDYQCKNPKGRGSQLCYTNRKLVSQVAQMARDYFDGKSTPPVGWKALGDYFAIVPDDNVNLCSCGECRALLDKRETWRTGHFSSGEMSDYWFSFVNAVAREVRKTHPNKYIATLAYWSYAVPPSFDVESNVSVAPCLHTCMYAIHAGIRENDMRLYGEWLKRAKGPMFLWVYYHHPMEPALIDKWKCFPNVMVHETARVMRMFIRDGVRGIFECGEQDQLEQYVMVKVWDDPSVNVDDLISEFFRLYFGPAGDPMKRFYVRLEEIACDPANYPHPYYSGSCIDWRGVAWTRLGTPERMKELGSLIAQADKLAGTETEKQRVALWRKAIWEWMCQGREEYLGTKKQEER